MSRWWSPPGLLLGPAALSPGPRSKPPGTPCLRRRLKRKEHNKQPSKQHRKYSANRCNHELTGPVGPSVDLRPSNVFLKPAGWLCGRHKVRKRFAFFPEWLCLPVYNLEYASGLRYHWHQTEKKKGSRKVFAYNHFNVRPSQQMEK